MNRALWPVFAFVFVSLTLGPVFAGNPVVASETALGAGPASARLERWADLTDAQGELLEMRTRLKTRQDDLVLERSEVERKSRLSSVALSGVALKELRMNLRFLELEVDQLKAEVEAKEHEVEFRRLLLAADASEGQAQESLVRMWEARRKAKAVAVEAAKFEIVCWRDVEERDKYLVAKEATHSEKLTRTLHGLERAKSKLRNRERELKFAEEAERDARALLAAGGRSAHQ